VDFIMTTPDDCTASSPSPATRPVADLETSPKPSSLLLLVEDDHATRSVVQKVLEQYGYRVLTAENGAEAVRLYQKHSPEVALVLTNMVMPVLDGPATIQALLQFDPETRIIACSGTNFRPTGLRHGKLVPVPFLQKPFTVEVLLSLIRGLLATPATTPDYVDQNVMKKSTAR
jgi:CheY-like chemotaxis protein